ncbi:unnamed protein product, partial [Rotaria sp. Silwood1]
MRGSDTCTFRDHETLTDDQIDFITTNLPLNCRKLVFRGTELTDIGVSYIATNLLLRGGNRSNNLMHLCLSNATISDDGVKSICCALLSNKNNKLGSLILDLNTGITCVGAQALGEMLEKMNHGNLKLLDLSYTSIGRDGVY